MTWKLFLDDVRDPTEPGYTVARTSDDGINTIIDKGEMPSFMSLDHDLGGEDTSMEFLKMLYELWEIKGSNPDNIPDFIVHSANPIGSKNIISYMKSWKRSTELS